MRILVIMGALLYSMPAIQSQTPEKIIEKVTAHWLELHNSFEEPQGVWGNYTLDLTLESLLFYDEKQNGEEYTGIVKEVFKKRGISPGDTISYKTQPFCSINFTLGMTTGNDEWFDGFIAESYRMYNEVARSPEGAIMINHKGNDRILIDYLQEYASRMAKTAYLTENTLLFSECVNQFLIYESLLRDSKTGLWSQGQGWCEDSTELGQGAWSRGHGWLLRGLVTSMEYLPEEYKSQLQPVLQRLSYSLLQVQAKSGIYHILLNLPVNKSAPDVSGTGMIAYYLSVAVNNGWLDENDFRKCILKATDMMKKYVTIKGEVLSSSKGPGPLCDYKEYIGYEPEIDEKHGFQGVIYGMMGEMNIK